MTATEASPNFAALLDAMVQRGRMRMDDVVGDDADIALCSITAMELLVGVEATLSTSC